MTNVELGDGRTLQGISINPDNLENQTMIWGRDAHKNSKRSRRRSKYCLKGSLRANLVRGKIILCALRKGTIEGAFAYGASGLILTNKDDPVKIVPYVFPSPSSYVNDKDGQTTYNFIKSHKRPIGSIFRSVEINDTTAPIVAPFSSRGPNRLSLGILKPDLTAPGVAILAAWSGVGVPSYITGDKRRVGYNILSGTSMACPHATGAAAYVKSFHPKWSPSAIKSSLMTTASPTSDSFKHGELAYGAGHINPIKAVHPGLVYDASESDYLRFLCGEGYKPKMIRSISRDKTFTCTNANRDLNYPSFNVYTKSKYFNVTFTREVTNVGPTYSKYKAKVTFPDNLTIVVIPRRLKFKARGQKRKFKVMVSGTIEAANTFYSASLVWVGKTLNVRSPVFVLRD